MNMILDFVNDVNTEIYHKTILIKAAALVDFFRKIRYSRIEITLKGGFTNDEKKSYDNTHLQQSDCILSRITTALSCTLTGAQPAGRAGITIRKNAESRGGNRHSETKRFSNPFRKGYHGTLEEICALDLIHSSHNRGIFIASLNAVMKHLGLVECTVHCKNDTPELCADDALHYIRSHYKNPKIALIGYQPALLEHLSAAFRLRAVDLNPEHIGQTRHEILIEDGNSDAVQQELCSWADLILCTGSTVCNGTIINYLPLRSKILFYGTSLAGAAKLMDLPRLCFADRYQ